MKVSASVLASINVCHSIVHTSRLKTRRLEETPRPASRKACRPAECKKKSFTNNHQQLLQLCVVLSAVAFATGAAARFCFAILAFLCLPRGTSSVSSFQTRPLTASHHLEIHMLGGNKFHLFSFCVFPVRPQDPRPKVKTLLLSQALLQKPAHELWLRSGATTSEACQCQLRT